MTVLARRAPPSPAARRAGGALAALVLHALVLAGLLQLGIRPSAAPGAAPSPPLQGRLLFLSPVQPLRALAAAAAPPASASTPPAPAPVRPLPARARLAAALRPLPESPMPVLPKTALEPRSEARAEPARDVVAPGAGGTVVPGRGEGAVAEPPAERADAGAGAAGALRVAAAPAQAPVRAAASGARPDYAHNPPPEYPLALREQGLGGVVWLRVRVDPEGRPAEIRLARGSGYRLLDDAAQRAVRQWRFVPAHEGGHSVASWVEFPIRFEMAGGLDG